MTFTLTLCIHQQAEKGYIYSKTLEFFNAVEGRRGIKLKSFRFEDEIEYE